MRVVFFSLLVEVGIDPKERNPRPMIYIAHILEDQTQRTQKRKMPRTTKRSQGNDTAPLGTCWSERELKAVLKAARDAEKKEIQQASPEVEAQESAGIDELATEMVKRSIADAIGLVESEKVETTADPGVDAMPVEEEDVDADTACDAEVAQITTMVVYEGIPTDLRAGSSLTATPVVSRAPTPTESADGEKPIQEIDVDGPNAKKPGEEKAQLILYGITKVAGKRPRLEIFDAANDSTELSSKKVKKCVWTSDNVPACLKGKEFTPNQALIHLRNALDGSKKSLGSNGINMKVHLTTVEEGAAQTLKSIISRGELHKYIT